MTSSTWTLKDIPNLAGKTAIVTGGNSGLGFELTKHLAANDCHVILACRDLQKGKDAKQKILACYANANITVKQLDLSSYESIDKFNHRIHKKFDKISLLINNAGILDHPYSETADGNELTFQTNYLGPFKLTRLLLPLFKEDDARVVTVTSYLAKEGSINVAHNNDGELDVSRLQGDKTTFDTAKAYANSKLADLMFALELHHHLLKSGSKIKSLAAHPGYASTNILAHESSFFKTVAIKLGNALLAQSSEKGIIPIMYACVSNNVKSGEYYGPDGAILGLSGDHPKLVEPPKQAKDSDNCNRLWKASKQLTKGNVNKMQMIERDEIKKKKSKK